MHCAGKYPPPYCFYLLLLLLLVSEFRTERIPMSQIIPFFKTQLINCTSLFGRILDGVKSFVSVEGEYNTGENNMACMYSLYMYAVACYNYWHTFIKHSRQIC